MSHRHTAIVRLVAALCLPIAWGNAQARVVINEFVYDSPGGSFVEIYNAGNAPATLSNSFLLPAQVIYALVDISGPQLLPGQFRTYNVPLSTGLGSIVLFDDTWAIRDQVTWEEVRAPVVLGAGNIGEGTYIWGEHRSAAAPFATSWQRQVDGFDSDNNARDFRVMPATLNASNNRSSVLPWSSTFSTPPTNWNGTAAGPTARGGIGAFTTLGGAPGRVS